MPQDPLELLRKAHQEMQPAGQISRVAQESGATVTSTTGGRHNPGSKHYAGQAADIRTRDKSPEEVEALKQQFAGQGYRVLDERQRPAGQKVWGGPHLHVEADDLTPLRQAHNQLQQSNTPRPSQQTPGAYGPDIPTEMLPQPSKRPAQPPQPAAPVGPRIGAMPRTDFRRPLTKQIQNLGTSPLETLQQGMAQREQMLPETPELQAKRKAAEVYAQRSVPGQIYQTAKSIPGRTLTAAGQLGQRLETIGQGLAHGDITPLAATGAQLAGGLVTGIQDVAGNVSNYMQKPGTTPNPAAREAIQQQLGRFSYANAEAVKANARHAYEAAARKYLTDPNALSFDEMQALRAGQEEEARTQQTMAGNVTRAAGDALPAVAMGAAGGLPAALGTQAAMGDVERPLDTAVNMASVAVPMGLTRAARPRLNAATQGMRPIPRAVARTAGEMGVGAAGNVGQSLVTQPLLTGKIDPGKLVEDAAVGAAFGVNDVAQQGLANMRQVRNVAAERAPMNLTSPLTAGDNVLPRRTQIVPIDQAPPATKISTPATPPNLAATHSGNAPTPRSSRIAGLRAARNEAPAADGQPASPTGRTGKQAPFVVLDQSEWNNDPTPGYRQSVIKVGDVEHLIEYDPKQINASAASAKAKREIEQASERRMQQPVTRPVTSAQQAPTSADNAPVFEPRPAPPETGFEADISTRATDADAIIQEFVQRGRLPQLTEIRDRLGITRTEAQGIQAEIASRQKAARSPRSTTRGTILRKATALPEAIASQDRQQVEQAARDLQWAREMGYVDDDQTRAIINRATERQPLGQKTPTAAETQTAPGQEAPQQRLVDQLPSMSGDQARLSDLGAQIRQLEADIAKMQQRGNTRRVAELTPILEQTRQRLAEAQAETQTAEAPQQSVNAVSEQINKSRQANDLTPNGSLTSKLLAIKNPQQRPPVTTQREGGFRPDGSPLTPAQRAAAALNAEEQRAADKLGRLQEADALLRQEQAAQKPVNSPETQNLTGLIRRGVPPAQPLRPNVRPANVERMPRRQYSEYEGGEVRDYYKMPEVGEYGAKPAQQQQPPADVLPFHRRPPAPAAPRRPLHTQGPSDKSAGFPREQRDFVRQGRAIEEARATGTEGAGPFGRFAQQAYKSTVPDGMKGQTSFYESPNVKGALGLDADASASETRQAFKKTFARMMKVNADEVSLTQVPQWAWDAWMRRNAPRLGAEDKRRYQQTIRNAQDIEIAKAINENIQASDTQRPEQGAGRVQSDARANRSGDPFAADRANAGDEQVSAHGSLLESNAGRGKTSGTRRGDSGNVNTARDGRTSESGNAGNLRTPRNDSQPRGASVSSDAQANPDADFIHSLIADTGISRANLIKESGLTRGRINPALEQLKQQGRIVEEGNTLRRAGEVRAEENAAGETRPRAVTEAAKGAEAIPAAKEPWEMARAEYEKATSGRKPYGHHIGYKIETGKEEPTNYAAAEVARDQGLFIEEMKERGAVEAERRAVLRRALREGKFVPESVLADYPDLAAKLGKPEIATVKESLTVDQPRTITHDNPAINGKPVIAQTADGKSVVANPENKNGVSVVKDQAASSPSSPADFASVARAMYAEAPAAEGRALVSLANLRQRFPGVSKEEFDNAILEHARRDDLALHWHDYPSSLTEQERAALVYDPRAEKYYLGAAFVDPNSARVQEGIKGQAASSQSSPSEATQPAQPKEEGSVASAPRVNPAQTHVEKHLELFDRIEKGQANAAEIKASFEALAANKEAITAELAKLTKEGIFEKFPGLRRRYKNETKAEVVGAAFREMQSDYTLDQSFSYGMGDGSYAKGIRAVVEKHTDESLGKYAEKVKQAAAEREQQKKAALEGMAEPKTLEDFNRVIRAKAAEIGDGVTFQQVRMALTPEQRAQYDELAAAKSRDERRARADQQRTEVRVASQSMTGDVIETKHTKTGEPLFVVKAAERVERDVYNQWNATAKRLGGWYSSYRAGGAVPGFQFKTRANADAFLEYLGGKVDKAKEVAETRRDAMQDDKSQTAVERLREMADALDERADESLSVERKANTERRARFAASAESAANASKAMAKTMRNIADAIETGKAKFLDRVRQKVQVETLQNFVHSGQGDYLRSKYPTYAEQEKHFGEPPTKEAADHATFPTYTAYRSDLAKLGRQLVEQEGTKKLGAAILKEADDVTDAYLKFAKENLHKVSTFGRKDGSKAVFPNKAAAEAAIVRSGYKGQAIVLPFKRGENVIILSPSAAREKGIWEGDNDKRITLGNDIGDELVAKLKTLKRREIDVPWTFESAYDKRKRLAGMGIETPAELRAALREFIGLREQAKAPDKIKEMERAMIGRKNDGLDFFPTPASVADRMVEVADVKEGMSVLEPSAGMGHIADRLREAGVEPDVVEMASDRRELLKAKGYNLAGSDFMDAQGQYDRIVMNPPFSSRRDIEHVRHAYDLLKPEGRLVAIMGEGSFFGSDKKATEFREWLKSVGGTSEKLEEGSFLDPSLPVNTGVNARMVVIEKPAGAEPAQPQPVAEQTAPQVKTIDAKPAQAQNATQDESGTLTIKQVSTAQRGREVASVSAATAPVVRASQGNKTTVSVPRQRGKLPARYEVRELGDLIPSHNPFSFEPNPDYKLTNDRDYRNPANRLDVEGATKQGAFEPDIVLSDDPTATNGPPIIDGSNQVLGGNSRTMMIARTYRNNPTDAQAYRERLKAKAAQYGFDAKAVDGFDQPVLVRVLDTSAKDVQQLVTAFNVQPGKAISTAERAAAQSRNLKPETADYLARRIDLEGESGTLLKALEGEKGIAVLNRLIQDGAIPEGDRNAMVDRGKLSESAKLQIRKLFTGRMYRDARQMETAPPLVANKLERIAPHVARLSGSDWDIAQHIPRAIDAIKEANSKNLNLDELNNQGAGLFGEAEPYSNEALAIARILQDFGVRQVEGKFRNYANAKADADKGGGMFGDVERQTDAFNRIFEASTPDLRYSGAAPHDLIKAIKDSELSKAIKEAWEEGKRIKAEEGRIAALKHGGLEAANAVRGLNLAGDLLALRQGARVSLSPRYWKQAGKDFGRALRAYKAKNYDAILDDLAKRSYTFDGEEVNLLEVLHDTAKIEFTGQHLRDLLKGGKAREEGYESRIVASLPVARNIEQVNASFMDLRRIDLGMRYLDAIQADKNIKTAEQLNQALQEMGRAINILSGRGQRVMVKTKPDEAPRQAVRLSNAILGSGPVLFNSPKYLTSHIQAFNESFNPLSRQITGTVRKEMLKDMLGWAGTMTAGLALAAAAGAEVGLDPDNADFGKIKIGNRRYDIGGAGSLTLLRLYWKLGKATVDSSAKNGKEAWDALARFTRGKLAPVPGFIATAKAPIFDPYAKKPFTEMSGEVVTPGRAALNRVLPIGAQEFYKAYEEDQMKGVLLTLPAELGAGVQNYASKRPSRYVLRRDPGEMLPSIKRGLRDAPSARRPVMPRQGQ